MDEVPRDDVAMEDGGHGALRRQLRHPTLRTEFDGRFGVHPELVCRDRVVVRVGCDCAAKDDAARDASPEHRGTLHH